MENTLYYTFSTIAQALAGGIALLGAFVLYRVQSIDRDFYEATDPLLMRWQDDQALQQLLTFGDMGGIVREIQRRIEVALIPPWSEYQQAKLHRAAQLVLARAAIINALRRALWFSAGVMCGAVAILSVVTWIASRQCLAASILTVGVVAFSISIVLFVRLILQIVALREVRLTTASSAA